MNFYCDHYYPQFPYSYYQSQRRDIAIRIANIQQQLLRKRQQEINRRVQQQQLLKLMDYQAQLMHRLQLLEQHQIRIAQQERQKQRLINQAEEQRLQFQHFQKLQRIKIQQDLIYRSKLAEKQKTHLENLRILNIVNDIENQRIKFSIDQQLTKQEIYQRELQKYYRQKICSDPKNSHLICPKYNQYQADKQSYSKKINYHSPKKLSQKNLDSSNKIRSPINNIHNKSNDFSINDNSNKKSYLEETNTKRKNQQQIQSERDPKKVSIRKNFNSMFEKEENLNNIENHLKQNVKDTLTPNKNRSQLSPYRKISSNKNKSSHKKSKIKNSISLSRSRRQKDGQKMTHQMQENGMKKIQNRLKLSSIVFIDSQKRNIKHEVNHLFNTFDNQNKARKDVKDKINTNPLILKKHKMVIQ